MIIKIWGRWEIGWGEGARGRVVGGYLGLCFDSFRFFVCVCDVTFLGFFRLCLVFYIWGSRIFVFGVGGFLAGFFRVITFFFVVLARFRDVFSRGFLRVSFRRFGRVGVCV